MEKDKQTPTKKKTAEKPGRIMASDSPVQVPNRPPKPDASTPDETARQSQPAANNSAESNWSDTTKPMPHAKKARTSIL